MKLVTFTTLTLLLALSACDRDEPKTRIAAEKELKQRDDCTFDCILRGMKKQNIPRDAIDRHQERYDAISDSCHAKCDLGPNEIMRLESRLASRYCCELCDREWLNRVEGCSVNGGPVTAPNPSKPNQECKSEETSRKCKDFECVKMCTLNNPQEETMLRQDLKNRERTARRCCETCGASWKSGTLREKSIVAFHAQFAKCDLSDRSQAECFIECIDATHLELA